MIEKRPMSIRVHPRIQEELKEIAKINDISVNATINLMLAHAIDEIKTGKRKIVSEIVATNKP